MQQYLTPIISMALIGVTIAAIRAYRGSISNAWVALPILAILIQADRNLLISPLLSSLGPQESADSIRIGTLGETERQIGVILILFAYTSILLGIYLYRIFKRQRARDSYCSGWSTITVNKNNRFSAEYILRRGWRISLVTFFIGLLAHLYVLSSLASTVGILQIASERAAYTSNLAIESAYYLYARVISSFALVGAISMVSFSSCKRQLKWSYLAAICILLVTMLYGGRSAAVYIVIVFALSYQLTVRRLSKKEIFTIGIFLFIAFSVASLLRFLGSFGTAYQSLIAGVSSSGAQRIDQTGWVYSLFPDQIPYLGAGGPFSILARLLPGLELKDAPSLYGAVIDHFYQGINYMGGIGGENYSTAAELYSWGGYSAILIYGVAAGCFFGMMFEWARKNPNNLVLQNFMVMVFVLGFFSGIEARLYSNISGIGYYFLGFGFIAAGIAGGKSSFLYYLAMLLALFFVVTWKLSGSDVLKYLAMLCFPLIYYLSYRMIRKIGLLLRQCMSE